MAAVGLKSYILNNNLKSVLLLAGFPVLLLLLLYGLELLLMGAGYLPRAGYGGNDFALAFRMLASSIPIAVVVAGVWFVIAYFGQQTIINLLTGAKGVSRQEEPDLYNLLENLAISRGLKVPALFVVEDEALNAYASGLNEGQYSVTVTRGLMNALSREELEAVLGHELTHIINRDVRLMIICAVFAGIISLVGQLIYRVLLYGGGGRRRDKDSKGGGGVLIVVGLVLIAVSYVLSIVLKFAISRQAEFLADAGSVELTKNPDAMIRALQKISQNPHLDAPEQIRPLFIFDDSKDLFSTHPSIEKRIDALVRYAGGRYEPLPEPEAAPALEAAPGYAEIAPEEPLDAGPSETPRRGPWG
jgi:heat shock protein HtpX